MVKSNSNFRLVLNEIEVLECARRARLGRLNFAAKLIQDNDDDAVSKSRGSSRQLMMKSGCRVPMPVDAPPTPCMKADFRRVYS